MTQNNEHDAKVKLARLRFFRDLSDEESLKIFHIFGVLPDDYDGLMNLNIQSTLFDKWQARVQSPISQNEQQEAVAEIVCDPMFLPALKVPLVVWKADIVKFRIGTELYTSPTKQIPDGYSTEDEHFASTLEELAEQFLNSYEAGDVITVHLSKDLGSQDYKYCFDATGKPFLEPTNTEVGE